MKSKTLTTPNAGNGNRSSYSLLGIQNSIQPLLRASWKLLTQLSILLLYDTAFMLLGIHQNKYLSPHKILYMDVYSGFIHNYLSLEVTKMSFSSLVDK